MRGHGMLLARKPRFTRPERRHNGKVAVKRSDKRWCSDGFEFRCDNGEPLRVTFALDCCDREAISWAATTAGHSGEVVRDVPKPDANTAAYNLALAFEHYNETHPHSALK